VALCLIFFRLALTAGDGLGTIPPMTTNYSERLTTRTKLIHAIVAAARHAHADPERLRAALAELDAYDAQMMAVRR
jgi:hypothetical protein